MRMIGDKSSTKAITAIHIKVFVLIYAQSYLHIYRWKAISDGLQYWQDEKTKTPDE